jgi:hypothetical protein
MSKRMYNLPKTKVYELSITKRDIFGYRQSNQTILVPKHILPDSDRLALEDKYGYRYARDISLEYDLSTRRAIVPYYIFKIY